MTAKIIVTAASLALVALINWYFLVSGRRPRKR